ncbi:MAG: sulfur carrier protein ThiS [Sulfurovaceae bacterium]
MSIVVNGKNMSIEKDTNLYELIEFLKISDKVMAAAVNMNIVKKDEWENYKLQEGDKVELLNFVGGG